MKSETGKYGFWSIGNEVTRIRENKKRKYRRCLCICGKEKLVRVDHLENGKSKSCGCKRHKLRNKPNFLDQTIDKAIQATKDRDIDDLITAMATVINKIREPERKEIE